jgi:catechol 2,3-dioxygenase-like lactoylglutathione lyase family enzyme
MALELFMVGLIVRDMEAAVTFYRRLGLAVPEGSETKPHVQIKMESGLTLFLDTKPWRWDPQFGEEVEQQPSTAGNGYPFMLEFYLKEQATLNAKYAELLEYGYEGFREPYLMPYNMYFAMIKDPDGNTILLSADPEPNKTN